MNQSREGDTMSRKGAAPKREVLADPIYNSKKVTKLINQIMLDGKKGAAERAVYGAFDIIAEKTGKDALTHFKEIKTKGNYTLIKCQIETGRKHQIRVHLNHLHQM